MENFKVIELQHTRDFSRKMNATFEFIKQNFKSLGKSLVFIAGPPILIGSLMMATFIGKFMNMASGLSNPANSGLLMDSMLSPSFWLELVLMMVFLVLSGVTTVATINNYIILYDEKKTNAIEVAEVWERVRSTFWMYFGTAFLFTTLAVLLYIVAAIPIVLLVRVSPVLVFFVVFALIIGGIYTFYAVSLVFFIRGYERIGFFEAVGRSFKLVAGKWWSTFGLITLLYIIVTMVSYVFLIPVYIITFVTMLHKTSGDAFQEPSTSAQLLTTTLYTLSYVVSLLLSSLPNVGIAFQYFNLVELKESRGLMSKIENFGQPSAPSVQDEQY